MKKEIESYHGRSLGDDIIARFERENRYRANRAPQYTVHRKSGKNRGNKLRKFAASRPGRVAIAAVLVAGTVTSPGQYAMKESLKLGCSKVAEVPKVCDKALYELPPEEIISSAKFPSAITPDKKLGKIASYKIVTDNDLSFAMNTTPIAGSNIPKVNSISVVVELDIIDKQKLAEMAPDKYNDKAAKALSVGDWVYWMIIAKNAADKQTLRESCIEDMNDIVEMARKHAGSLTYPFLAPQMYNGESTYSFTQKSATEPYPQLDDPNKPNIDVTFITPTQDRVTQVPARLRCE